jgi:hypothetical protein
MKYLKKYNLFENFENKFEFISKDIYDIREDLISVSVVDSEVGYDFLVEKDEKNKEVLYEFEPDSFIKSMGINDNNYLKDSQLKKWLISLDEKSIGNLNTLNRTELKVDKFQNQEFLKKGILKVKYNGEVISFLIEEGDLENDDIIKFNKNEDRILADKIGLNLDQRTKEQLLELYYQ